MNGCKAAREEMFRIHDGRDEDEKEDEDAAPPPADTSEGKRRRKRVVIQMVEVTFKSTVARNWLKDSNSLIDPISPRLPELWMRMARVKEEEEEEEDDEVS